MPHCSPQVIVEETKLFKVTVSFGNVNSLISLPCYMSHASIPADVRAARGLPDDLVRISAGIEHIDDLVADLDQVRGASLDGETSHTTHTPVTPHPWLAHQPRVHAREPGVPHP